MKVKCLKTLFVYELRTLTYSVDADGNAAGTCGSIVVGGGKVRFNLFLDISTLLLHVSYGFWNASVNGEKVESNISWQTFLFLSNSSFQQKLFSDEDFAHKKSFNRLTSN